jgi:hypothetical protein
MIKTIGKDTVVIMTVKQGEDINNQFKSMNDTIQTLRNKTLSLNVKMTEQKQSLDSQLVIKNDQIDLSKKEYEKVKAQVLKTEKTIKKTDLFVRFTMAAFIILILITHK